MQSGGYPTHHKLRHHCEEACMATVSGPEEWLSPEVVIELGANLP